MADVINAIEIENVYLTGKMNGKEPFHLIDEIKKCGFKSLEEYFEVKRRYKFRQLEFTVKDVIQDDIVSEAVYILENKVTGVRFVDSTKTCVFSGNEGMESFNSEYCTANNIEVYPLLAGGGAIIHQDGDFSWGVSCPESINMDTQFLLNAAKNILQKHTEKKVIVDNNDILIDGKKVCGSTTYVKNNTFLFISYYSFNDKSELINSICNKETTKTPGYIDFITREQFRQEVKAWLKLNSI